jgi:dipeptidyl aminopeptidase/acylaminoacyl peptidase
MVGRVPTPFEDLDEYLAIPRVTGLRLAPDGTWLAASVATLSADRTKMMSSIWRIDTAGGPARRLTRSARGEGRPAFLPDGSLLFISQRPDPGLAPSEKESKPALWLLPADGGEATVIATLPGGVTAAETGSAGGIVITGPVLDAVRAGGEGGTAEADERLRAGRAEAGISAVLHESGIVRFWDQDLGPDDLRMFAVSPDSDGAPQDLTPEASRAFIEHTFAVSPDGAWVATSWYWWHGAQYHGDLVLIEIATGNRKVLLSAPDADFHDPAFTPDSKSLACVRTSHDTAGGPGDSTLVLVSLDGNGGDSAVRDILPRFDRWPGKPAWHPDGQLAYFTADDGGRRSVFRVDVTTGEAAKVTADDGHYTAVCPAPDGTVYALRDAVDETPTPVRLDPASGAFERLPAPGQHPPVPGALTEIEATADDGQPIRGWLVLPEGASADHPAPLLLWVHGGPRGSWNSWQWRWNPWLAAAKGYAVLLPDPALSTGYGLEFVKRGYRAWGPRTFADVMAITDAAVARADIDGERTAMMGGSFGGYMANWIAGHTDRFGAIVSHASLWAMDQMMATTDAPASFLPEFADPEVLAANSPHWHVAAITTPMLVIHGDRDYRVPVGEALRLWWDLQRHGKTAKFLYFPDENHWILSPGNVKAWYRSVFAFLGHYVLGEPWQRPELL